MTAIVSSMLSNDVIQFIFIANVNNKYYYYGVMTEKHIICSR